MTAGVETLPVTKRGGKEFYTMPPGGRWVCFHCAAIFPAATEQGRAEALAHFGPTPAAVVACKIDEKAYREMEALVAKYREEDTDLHREIHRLHSEHAVALRREEEKGYARGLADARAEWTPGDLDRARHS